MVSVSALPDWPNAKEYGAVYVIGDVHGRRDLLEEMLEWIAADADAPRRGGACVISVGDLVDRGPDVAGVLEVFAAGDWNGLDLRVVRGNHEDMMLDAIDGADSSTWMANGGRETLESYGAGSAAELARRIPNRHEALLRDAPLAIRAGDHLIVHAGIRPGVVPERQSAADLLWIREPFLSDDSPRDVVVVHGHTIVREPVVRTWRIGIDTGAWMSGVLTCLALQDDRRRLRQTARPAFGI